ncbi:hypothetical protein DPMN_100284 [Dreissena polymorpha]|uniref:SREBP regulating gene protein n=1 Tax=Dreissena polymorpha TaxID=45954 RepID=A0A9D4R8I6_DREPO|nr:hypothetical protein DPMN_100284 [Dreissena polymorpha]
MTQSANASVYEVQHTLLRQPFQWHPKVSDVVGESSNITVCRNSVQGRQLIVDERGYICYHEGLTSGGCCSAQLGVSRYNCSTCKNNGCCYVYEHCISCCLEPQKKPILQRILQEARDNKEKLLVSVSDPFELCLAKCRTSSKSVQHENSYRDPSAKYCYGEDPPELQLVAT